MKDPKPPIKIIVTATKARRDFGNILNRSHFDNHIFFVKKKGQIIALIKGVNYRKYQPVLSISELLNE